MPADPLSVRPAGPRDLDEVARIWHTGWTDAHAEHVDADLVAERDAASFRSRAWSRLSQTLACVSDDRLAGFVVTVDDEVEQLYVDRAWRGKGAAALLLGAAQEQIATRGHRRAWLAVIPENSRARSFYARSGWRDEGRFDYPAESTTGVVPVDCRRYVIDLPAEPSGPGAEVVR